VHSNHASTTIANQSDMQKLKKAVKAVGASKVHPSNSMDADTEMAEPPRRRRQSFSSEVLAEDAPSGRMSPALQRISGRRPSFDNIAARRPSLNSDSGLTPTSQPATPASADVRRRRSLSNGRDGGAPNMTGSPIISRRGSLEPIDTADVSRSSPIDDDLQSRSDRAKLDKAHRKISAVLALKGEHSEPQAAQRVTAEHIQSQALQNFFSNAQSSNSWSASSKKMIFASQIDDSKMQSRGKLETRCTLQSIRVLCPWR